MIWRGICDDCGRPVIWGGEDSAKPDIPSNGQKVLCLSCLGLELKGDAGVKSADIAVEEVEHGNDRGN